MTNAARVVRFLHGALLAGLIVVGLAFALVRRFRLSPSIDVAPMIGLVLASAGFVVLAVAALVLRPRMPERRPDQSADAYWMAVESRGAALVLWSVVQGAGLMASVGYFLTGAAAPVVAGALALMALVLFRPSRLEGE